MAPEQVENLINGGSEEADLGTFESLLENAAYAQLSQEEFQQLGDSHFSKLFRLGQMSTEYLMYTQNYIEMASKSLNI